MLTRQNLMMLDIAWGILHDLCENLNILEILCHIHNMCHLALYSLVWITYFSLDNYDLKLARLFSEV